MELRAIDGDGATSIAAVGSAASATNATWWLNVFDATSMAPRWPEGVQGSGAAYGVNLLSSGVTWFVGAASRYQSSLFLGRVDRGPVSPEAKLLEYGAAAVLDIEGSLVQAQSDGRVFLSSTGEAATYCP